MKASFFTRHPRLHDALSLAVFVALVAIGTLLINTFVFRSFSVEGPSMESTMYTGDRLIVNRIPVTIANLRGHSYAPERGTIIVFKNPRYVEGRRDEYLVKRVIALPGERVTVEAGVLKVHNDDYPDGFEPDQTFTNGHPGSPTSGFTDTVVPNESVFVAGDHREGNYSLDSRNDLGTIPYFDIVGPVSLRIWPLPSFSRF